MHAFLRFFVQNASLLPIHVLDVSAVFSFDFLCYINIESMGGQWVALCLLLWACSCQQRSKAQEVAQAENEMRSANQMSYTNIKSYTFLCGRFDDFLLRPSTSKEIKVELHNYWKKENVYVSAEYSEGEEVRVIVYENHQRVLLDRQYFMTTGFSFNATAGSAYLIRFLAQGTATKLVSMITSAPLHVSDDVATKEHIEGAQQKVEKIGNELKALLTISQRNFLMKEQIGGKILANTKVYMVYEVFEVILIIGVAVLQVVYLTRLLKGGSIV